MSLVIERRGVHPPPRREIAVFVFWFWIYVRARRAAIVVVVVAMGTTRIRRRHIDRYDGARGGR